MCSTIFRLLWSSGNCVCGGENAGVGGICEIYCRQFRSNFGKPLNVSYQYAMHICSLLCACVNIAGIILLFFYSSPCRKLNMKINFFRIFKYLFGKLILNSLSELNNLCSWLADGKLNKNHFSKYFFCKFVNVSSRVPSLMPMAFEIFK